MTPRRALEPRPERVTDPPPPEVAHDLRRLASALDASIPAKLLDRNLLVGTWRWERFDRVTEKWLADEDDAERRDLRSIRCVAEVVSRFDVLGIQGVVGNARALSLVMQALGERWSLMVTGLSRESTYNERTAFIFDTRKVQLRGLAGQVVLPQDRQQFFRPPFFAGFRCLHQDFTLANVHIVFGHDLGRRDAEVRDFFSWLRGEALRGYDWERNLIALGQLQLGRRDSELRRHLASAGLHEPDDLVGVPTFVGASYRPTLAASTVAWFRGDGDVEELGIEYVRGGVFDLFEPSLPFRERPLHASRHLPVWVQFLVRRKLPRATAPWAPA